MTRDAFSLAGSRASSDDAIAVIGLGVRVPGAATPRELWQNLVRGAENIRTYTDEELLAAGVPAASLADPAYVKAGALIAGSAAFDAAFFGFSPREAELIDPQQRLFLECAWECLEDAGYDVERLTMPVGVFASASRTSYAAAIESHPELAAAAGTFQIAVANDKDFLPTRASYKLGLRGPSVLVQTACSSSLVAVHMASQSLRRDECRMALAGGSAVPLHEAAGYWAHDGGILSPDGHCRAFAAAAAGTVPGCGVGVVALKRLRDAQADGDHIYALILGSAVNNDGKEKIGYTAPSAEGQAEVIAAALSVARVDCASVSYVEAHGTGTQLGDLIELTALQRVFGNTPRRRPCAIGSIKSNLGHVDVAAGVVGLIKTVLALHHRTLPATLHCATPHHGLDPAVLRVQTQTATWDVDGPRRAGVSSFGIGGTNAHIVLEESRPEHPVATRRAPALVVISARSPSALRRGRERLAAHLRERSELSLADVAHTLQHGRAAFARRFAVSCRSVDDAVSALESPDNGAVATVSARAAVFMFPGQGPQYPRMAEGLYATWQTFRESVDHCAEILRPELDVDMREVLLSTGTRGVDERIHRLEWSLPALFSIEYSLAKLWEAWGVRPAAMIGHSMGEYVAACIAGVFSLRDALHLVLLRGRLMQSLPEGAMVAVPLPEREVQPLLAGELSLAAVNGPALCVISGPPAEVASLERTLASLEVECQRLAIDRAAHSTMLAPIVEPFVAAVRAAKPRAPSLPFISNLTGRWIRPEEATDPVYWGRQLREPVRFADGIAQLLSDPANMFLEVGPGRMLGSLVRRQAAPAQRQVFASMRHGSEAADDATLFLSTVGDVWRVGIDVRWPAGDGRRIPLPTYPFERQSYLVRHRSRQGGESSRSDAPHGTIIRENDLSKWFYVPGWRQVARPARSRDAAADPPARWIIFADDRGIAAELERALRRDGDDVVTVDQSTHFRRTGAAHFGIDPADRDQYLRLLSSIPRDGRPTQVAHLWSLGRAARPDDAVARFDHAQTHGFLSMLHLIQACEETAVEAQRIVIATNGAHDVGRGDSGGRPEQATAAGIALVAPRELEGMSCSWVDLLLDDDATTSVAAAARHLHDEIRRGAAGTASPVAYRDGRCWTPTLEPCALQPEGGIPVPARSGAYLISGGLGGMGLAIAESLARERRANLVLVGRSIIPPRAEWDALLANGSADARILGKIRRLREIEATGASLLIASADVSDADRMQQVARDACARFDSVSGVIHAAGVPGGHMLHRLTTDDVRGVFAPKAAGLLVLERLFDGEELDVFVICSALNSFIGAVGLADYCGANAFLDAYADRMRRRGVNVVTVNWGLWRDVGMAVDVRTGAPSTRALSQGMSPAEGVEALWRVLRSELPRVAVSTQNLTEVMRSAASVTAASARLPAAPAEVMPTREATSVPYVAPADPVELSVAEIWSTLLGVKPIGVHDDFLALGGHSLLGVQVLSRIRREFNVRLPMRVLFESPTIAQLAARITDELIAGVESMSDEEAARLLHGHESAAGTASVTMNSAD